MQRGWSRLLWWSWALIVLLVGLTHLFGQRWFVVGALVYCPPQMWLCGLVLIGLLALRSHRRLALVCLGTAFILAGPLWEWRTHRAPVKPELWSDPNTIRVLTVNRGDHHGHSTAAYILEKNPDVIAMQDSIMPQAYVPGAPEYAALPNRSRMSEFVLLSRYPITKTELLMTKLQPGATAQPVMFKAARWRLAAPFPRLRGWSFWAAASAAAAAAARPGGTASFCCACARRGRSGLRAAAPPRAAYRCATATLPPRRRSRRSCAAR
jgi:hypothetical protein